MGYGHRYAFDRKHLTFCSGYTCVIGGKLLDFCFMLLALKWVREKALRRQGYRGANLLTIMQPNAEGAWHPRHALGREREERLRTSLLSLSLRGKARFVEFSLPKHDRERKRKLFRLSRLLKKTRKIREDKHGVGWHGFRANAEDRADRVGWHKISPRTLGCA